MISLIMRFLYFFLATLPLVILPGGNQVYEMAKFSWLLMGVGIVLCIRAYELWNVGKTEAATITHHSNNYAHTFTQHTWWWLTAALYMLYLFYNTIISLSPEVSFWGSYIRHGGLLTVLALVALLLVLVTRNINRKEETGILLSLVTGGVVAAVISIFQRILLLMQEHLPKGSFADIAHNVQVMGDRVFGSMGHPNFLGQLLVAVILLSLIVLYRKPSKYVRVYLIAGIMVQVVALCFTWNRASFIALVVGLGLMYVLYAWYQKKRLHRIGASVLLCTMVLMTSVYLQGAFSSTQERSLSSRAVLFPKVVELVQSNPWVGSGLDSFGYAFSPFIPIELYETENFSQLPDKAHNDILDTLVEQGVVGLSFIVILAIWLLIKIFRMPKGSEQYTALMYAIVLVALEVSFLAGFATTVHKVVMIILVSVILQQVSAKETGAWGGRWTAYPAVVIGIAFIVIGGRFYIGDTLYASAFAENNQVTFRQSLAITPFSFEYKLFGKSILEDIEEQRVILGEAYDSNPYDIYAPLFLAQHAQKIGDLELTVRYLDQAEQLCSVCSDIPYYGAVFMSQLGDTVRAVHYAKAYIKLLPSFMVRPVGELSSYETERRRIFTKEQGKRLDGMRELAERG